MNSFKIASTVACLCVSSAFAATYTDATNDLFENSFGNLDIASVAVSNTATNITFAVTTRDFANWTKYVFFINTNGTGDGSNAWNRPVNQSGGNANYIIGSWVDQATDNSQFVAYESGGWNWGNYQTFSNSQSGNTVSWTVSLASMGLSSGSQFSFDVATSGGGGGDPGVDHLSRSDVATTGWSNASVAGTFLNYTVTAVPAPGAIALVGLAGLVGKRRRS